VGLALHGEENGTKRQKAQDYSLGLKDYSFSHNLCSLFVGESPGVGILGSVIRSCPCETLPSDSAARTAAAIGVFNMEGSLSPILRFFLFRGNLVGIPRNSTPHTPAFLQE